MILLKLNNRSTNLGKSECVKMPETENEAISLWILEQKRQENRSKAQKELAQRAQIDAVEDNYHCLKCKKSFAEPKLVQYYALPTLPKQIRRKSESRSPILVWFLEWKRQKRIDTSGMRRMRKKLWLVCYINITNSS